MDEKTKELIAVGASVAAHCQPCLRYHVDQALGLGIDRDEIEAAIAVGKTVQKGGLTAMRKYAEELLARLPAAGQDVASTAPRRQTVLKIYEPAMCCSTGVCGPTVDPRLVAFAGALKQIAAQGVTVERFNLAQEPQAFVADPKVKSQLAERGHDQLPFIYVDDELKFSGSYPQPAALFAALDLDAATIQPPADAAGSIMTALPGAAGGDSGGCCDDGGCC